MSKTLNVRSIASTINASFARFFLTRISPDDDSRMRERGHRTQVLFSLINKNTCQPIHRLHLFTNSVWSIDGVISSLSFSSSEGKWTNIHWSISTQREVLKSVRTREWQSDKEGEGDSAYRSFDRQRKICVYLFTLIVCSVACSKIDINTCRLWLRLHKRFDDVRTKNMTARGRKNMSNNQ